MQLGFSSFGQRCPPCRFSFLAPTDTFNPRTSSSVVFLPASQGRSSSRCLGATLFQAAMLPSSGSPRRSTPTSPLPPHDTSGLSPPFFFSWQLEYPIPMPILAFQSRFRRLSLEAATPSVALASSMPAVLSAWIGVVVAHIASSASPSSCASALASESPASSSSQYPGSSGKTEVFPDSTNTHTGSSRSSVCGLSHFTGSKRGSSVMHRSVAALPHLWVLEQMVCKGLRGLS